MTPMCIGCQRSPDEISEYSPEETGEDIAPTEYVKTEEGTYNESNGHFACTMCYILMGMPSSDEGWKAP